MAKWKILVEPVGAEPCTPWTDTGEVYDDAALPLHGIVPGEPGYLELKQMTDGRCYAAEMISA